MYSSNIKIRVRYAETDKMGFVYYGNYATYYEVGRAELMRELGITYKEMEEKGCLMPMLEMSVKYYKPARYDDVLNVITTVKNIPQTRMHFSYEIYNDETNELINIGETSLTFINATTYKPMKAPEWFLELINNKIKQQQLKLNPSFNTNTINTK
ncbi:MAG: thioesterase family protein [Bacteroidales bacterium]|nr:thioesterase family protein [Bacteroidales bacterium]